MRIGLLFMGNETSEIWGSAITTYYLGEALKDLGHEVWRVSVQSKNANWEKKLDKRTQLVIAEGISAKDIPEIVWDKTDYVVQWWLTTLFYDEAEIKTSPFHAIATNSSKCTEQLTAQNVLARTIELAAPASFINAKPHSAYHSLATYLGSYPLKTAAQMNMMFLPASMFGLSIWGYGWEESPYREWYRGPLPLRDIGSLYKSVNVVLALTEQEQRDLGMINNRIFEALAVGAVVISDRHAALEAHEIGPYVNFVERPEKVEDLLASLVQTQALRKRAKEGELVVLAKHTYHQRAEEFIKLYQVLVGAYGNNTTKR